MTEQRTQEVVTAAGRTLLATWARHRTHPPSQAREREFIAHIVAIEQEGLDDARAVTEAARRMLAATEHHRDTMNGTGHPGVEHDQVLAHPYDSIFGPDVAVFSTVDDCAACGGAQYGADELVSAAWGDLRVAFGLERYRWQPEYPAEVFAPYLAAITERLTIDPTPPRSYSDADR